MWLGHCPLELFYDHICIVCSDINDYNGDQYVKIFLQPHQKEVIFSEVSCILQCLKAHKMHSRLKIHQWTQNTSYKAEIQQEVTTVSKEYWTQLLHCIVKVCLQQHIPSHLQSHCQEVYAIANVSGQFFFKSPHEASTSQFAPELVISYKLVPS